VVAHKRGLVGVAGNASKIIAELRATRKNQLRTAVKERKILKM
jgi:hypothetical protein